MIPGENPAPAAPSRARRKRNGSSRRDTLRKTASPDTPCESGLEPARLDIPHLRFRQGPNPREGPSKIAGIAGRPAAIDGEDMAVHVAVFRIGEEEGGDG